LLGAGFCLFYFIGRLGRPIKQGFARSEPAGRAKRISYCNYNVRKKPKEFKYHPLGFIAFD